MNNELLKRSLSSLILLPTVFFFIIKGSFYFNFFTLIILLITIYEWHNLSKSKKYYFPGFIFIFFSFYTFYLLRNDSDYGLFLLIIIICIGTDIGGYVFGKIIKGPKLTTISPNKTYAGMIGGFLLSIIFGFIYINNLTFFSLTSINLKMDINFFLVVLLISLISQIGDIIVSLFKRKSKFKNTGNIIPGHGGLLDRIDGLIFAYPFIYIFKYFFL